MYVSRKYHPNGLPGYEHIKINKYTNYGTGYILTEMIANFHPAPMDTIEAPSSVAKPNNFAWEF